VKKTTGIPYKKGPGGGVKQADRARYKRGEARDKFGKTALHVAASYGTPVNIAALLSAGADVEARGKNGMTPLHIAAMLGTPDNIVALLEAGASGSVKAVNGKTPFGYAQDNDKVKGTAAYWALNDAQYE